jgi:uncharacterized membrane protein YhaH (DUF805 family)
MRTLFSFSAIARKTYWTWLGICLLSAFVVALAAINTAVSQYLPFMSPLNWVVSSLAVVFLVWTLIRRVRDLSGPVRLGLVLLGLSVGLLSFEDPRIAGNLALLLIVLLGVCPSAPKLPPSAV